MISRAEMKQKFIDALIATGKQTITKAEIKTIATKLGLKSTQFFTKDDSNKVESASSQHSYSVTV